MSAQHTLGPWGLTTTEPRDQWVLFSTTAKGPGNSQARDVGRFVGGEEDARLIAAAPDLLAALKRIDGICEGGESDPEIMAVMLTDIAAESRAAIAKATGGPA